MMRKQKLATRFKYVFIPNIISCACWSNGMCRLNKPRAGHLAVPAKRATQMHVASNNGQPGQQAKRACLVGQTAARQTAWQTVEVVQCPSQPASAVQTWASLLRCTPRLRRVAWPDRTDKSGPLVCLSPCGNAGTTRSPRPTEQNMAMIFHELLGLQRRRAKPLATL